MIDSNSRELRVAFQNALIIMVMAARDMLVPLPSTPQREAASVLAAKCRNFLRGNFMAMLHDLEHLPNTLNHIQPTSMSVSGALSGHPNALC
jgi:hypothetical protein